MIKTLTKKIIIFKKEAHSILSRHEESPSRIIELRKTYEDLGKLSITQDELFKQALRAVENGLYRASHVMAWAGFMDFIEEKLASDGFVKLRAIRSSWNISTIDDLRENVPEYQLIEATEKVGLYGKTIRKALHGLLNKRNECAHPSDYLPSLNDSLGYISELIQRIRLLKQKNL